MSSEIIMSSKLYISNNISPRWGHSCVLYKDNLYIFGGYSNSYKSSLYKLNLQDIHNITFSKIFYKKSPILNSIKRSLHTSIIYNNNYIIIYGGKTNFDNELKYNIKEPLIYNIKDNFFDIYSCENSPNIIRNSHTSSLIYNKYMFIYGGEESYNKINNSLKSYLLDINQKIFFEIKYQDENIINNRKFHSSCVVNRNIVFIFGGYKNNNYECIEYMIKFDFSLINIENIIKVNNINKNYKITIINNNFINKININSNYNINNICPLTRWGCSLNNYKNKELILFGGRNGIDFNDLWSYNIKNNSWKKIYILNNNYNIENDDVLKRRRHISFIYKNILFISGGYNSEKHFLNDMIIFNLNLRNDYNILNNNNINDDDNNNLLLIFNEKFGIKINKNKFFYYICNNDYKNLNIKNNKINFDFSVNNDFINKFIKFMYNGYFIDFFIDKNEIILILKIFYKLNLYETIKFFFMKLLKNCIAYDLNKIKLDDINFLINLIENSLNEKILIINQQKFSDINHLFFVNKKINNDIKSSNLIFNKFNLNILKIPKTIKILLEKFQNNNNIKTNNNIFFLLELLYYSDYFNYNEFYNETEIILSNIIYKNNFSDKILYLILICSFCTNSNILLKFLIEYFFKKKNYNIKNIIKNIKNIYKNTEFNNYIIHLWNKNFIYYKIIKNNSFFNNEYFDINNCNISNFNINFMNNNIKEKNNILNFLKKLLKYNDYYHFDIPNISI